MVFVAPASRRPCQGVVYVSIICPFWEWDRAGVRGEHYQCKGQNPHPFKNERDAAPREFESCLSEVRCRAEGCATRPKICQTMRTDVPPAERVATRQRLPESTVKEPLQLRAQSLGILGGLVLLSLGGGRPASLTPGIGLGLEGDKLAPTAVWAHSTPAQVVPVLTIPFEFFKQFIFVTVDVNDKGPRSFLLDSGASDNTINLRAGRELGLPLGHVRDLSNAGIGEGKTEESSAKEVSLRVQGKQLFSRNITVLDMAPFEKWIGRPIDGVLGAPLLEDYIVQIDYTNSVIKLYDPTGYVADDGKKRVIPIRIDGNRPFIEATVTTLAGNSFDAKLMIDTGNDAPLSLNAPFTLKHGLPGVQETGKNTTTGVAGTSDNVIGHVKELDIGGIKIPDLVTFFSAAEHGQSASAKYDGLIGNSLLKDFKITFDYSRKQMILQLSASN
jgi:hypothetical protein